MARARVTESSWAGPPILTDADGKFEYRPPGHEPFYQFTASHLTERLSAAAREHPRTRLPPQHLRDRVVAGAELRRPAGPSVGLVQAPEFDIRLCEPSGHGREGRRLVLFVEQAAGFLSHRDRGCGIAGEKLDVDCDVSPDPRDGESSTPLGQLRQ